MPKTDKNTVFYDLTLSQEIVHYSLTYSPNKQAMNIVMCLYIKNKFDFDLMKKAVQAEIARNDCLRLYYKKIGGKIKQYFIEPDEAEKLPLNIVTADFTGRTEEEQDDYIMRDAAVPVHYRKDEIYRFIFIKTVDGGNALYYAVCHVNMDAVGLFLTLQDLLCIYRSLEGKAEIPQPFFLYKDFILREQAKFENGSVPEKSRNYYLGIFKKGGEPVYCSPTGIGALEKLRKKRRNPDLRSYPIYDPRQDESKNIKFHLSWDFTKQIDDYCASENVSCQSIFQLAICAWLSKINNNAADVMYLINCGRRTAMADKKSFGCMVAGLTIRMTVDSSLNFRDTLSKISPEVTQTYRHTHYSGIEAAYDLQKMYKSDVFDNYFSFLLSYLPFGTVENWEYDTRWISNGRFPMGLYCVVIHNSADGAYDIYYEYRTKMMNADHITALFNGMTEIIRLGMQNPEEPLSEILSKVK